jgi:hypothetical protein
MVNILVVLVCITIICIVGYAAYTIYSQMHPGGNVISPTSIPVSTVFSNSTSNSIAQNNTYQTVNISERDFENNQVNFSIVPSVVNVVTGNKVTFVIINATFSVGLGSIIPPGANAILRFSAPSPGNYVIFSPIAGQEALGMRATLVVWASNYT